MRERDQVVDQAGEARAGELQQPLDRRRRGQVVVRHQQVGQRTGKSLGQPFDAGFAAQEQLGLEPPAQPPRRPRGAGLAAPVRGQCLDVALRRRAASRPMRPRGPRPQGMVCSEDSSWRA